MSHKPVPDILVVTQVLLFFMMNISEITDENKENQNLLGFHFKSESLSSVSSNLRYLQAQQDVFSTVLDVPLIEDSKLEGPLCHHPDLDEHSRALVIVWLSEVSQAYSVTCQSFFLAIDFLDRFLLKTRNISKNDFQKIGITALFMAVKIEEVYPPRLYEFANVSAGTCTEDTMRDQEIQMLEILDWQLSTVTVASCLNLYCQLYECVKARGLRKETLKHYAVNGDMSSHNLQCPNLYSVFNKHLIYTKEHYDPLLYRKVSRLLTFAALDINWFNFPSAILAASAMYFIIGDDVFKATNFSFVNLEVCIDWMMPFHEVLKTMPPAELRQPAVQRAELLSHIHRVQHHDVDMTMFDSVRELTRKRSNLHFLKNISNRVQSSLKKSRIESQ